MTFHTAGASEANSAVEELTATLAAELGVTVMQVSLARWLTAGDDRELDAIVPEVLTALRALAAEDRPPGSRRRSGLPMRTP